MNFDILDSLLKQGHISRRKLAIAVGIPESTMSTAFMRKSGLKQEDVNKIAKYLGVSPLFLDGWEVRQQKEDDNDYCYLIYKDGQYQGKISSSSGFRSPAEALEAFFRWNETPDFLPNDEMDRHITLELIKLSGIIPEEIVDAYLSLNTIGKNEAVKRVKELTELPRYTTPDKEQGE